jgi:Spy/CpxP family protein refolding chaperone
MPLGNIWLKHLALIMIVSVAGPPLAVHAQSVPSDRDALENSSGSGMASYADANKYPGPLHVLEMSDQLELTDEQLKHIEAIYDDMKEKARAKGDIIIRKEEELSRMFSSATAHEESVLQTAREIGTLRGELRAVHLLAHLQAADVLSESQRLLYHHLRHGNGGSHSHHEGVK